MRNQIILVVLALVLVSLASAVIAPPKTTILINKSQVAINATYEEDVFSYTLGEIFDSRATRMTSQTKPNDGRAHDSFLTTAVLPPGQYSYSITASDVAGNIRTDVRNFTITASGNPGCGDGRLVSPEECDDGNSASGDGCNALCQSERCGNSRVDQGEECDGTSLSGMTCSGLDSFTGGTLSCRSNCRFDTSKCTQGSRVCGNGIIEPGEQCDGQNFGSIVDCNGFDSAFTGGRLTCTSSCIFDTSQCQGFKAGTCGDGQLAVGEQCDGRARLECSDFDNFVSGSLTCKTDCKYDTSQCVKASARCGDGEINVNETCDTANWGRVTGCTAFTSFTGGTLSCSKQCNFDTSRCTLGGSTQNSSCFNGVKDGAEADVDCGGSCLCCPQTRTCTSDADCCSNSCQNGVCGSASCSDRVRNGLETDIDCGGDCPSCADEASCSIDNDCESGFCQEGTCGRPSCTDLISNGLESDVDCGGSCGPCSNGAKCFAGADCSSGSCEAGICSADRSLDTDGDGIPDWWEERYGLDPLDPSDASDDPDDDGIENLDEYFEGSDPTVPDGVKNRTLQIILLTLGLLIIAGSTGFLVYYRKYMMPQPVRQQPYRPAPMQQRAPIVQQQVARPAQRPVQRPVVKKPVQRSSVRDSIMKSFGGSDDKPVQKPTQRPAQKPVQKSEPEKPSSAFSRLNELTKSEAEDPEQTINELYKKRAKK